MVLTSFRIAALAVGALALAGAAAQANGNASDLDCGIHTQTERGMLTVEGVVTSPVAMEGEYRFSLKSSGGGGSSNINQGGQFSIAAGTSASLGQVMVNAGSAVDVEFTVSSGGKEFDCSDPLVTHT